MLRLDGVTWRVAVVGRWVALTLGSLMVLFFLAFFFGEGPPRISALTAVEKLQFLAMGSLFLGLALAWKWEGFGGLLAVAGFVALVAISRNALRLWALYLPAAIGAVHVACWWRLRASAPAHRTPWHVPRNALFALGAALALFLILCANEMFGQPPLMTPTLRPSGNLPGTWTGTSRPDIVFTLHEDGSVTGTIAAAPVAAASIAYGRSWFGKLMHWNADYVIRGRLSGRDFSAPLMARGQTLQGSLFLNGQPMRLILRKR
jgi:hypothetical protein